MVPLTLLDYLSILIFGQKEKDERSFMFKLLLGHVYVLTPSLLDKKMLYFPDLRISDGPPADPRTVW